MSVRSSTCHQCRESVRGTRDSHHTADVVEVYRKIAPNSGLTTARTAQELLTLREKYRPGQGPTAQNESESDENEQPSSAGASLDGMDSPWQQNAAFNLVTGVPLAREFRWTAESEIRYVSDVVHLPSNFF